MIDREAVKGVDTPELPIAFAQAYRTYAGALSSYVRRRVADRDLTEEILQEVFLALWRSMQRHLEIRSIKNWIFRVAHHKITDYYRRESGGRRAQIESQATRSLSPIAPDPAPLVTDRLVAADVVAQFGSAHRWLYELIANYELTYAEAGELLHIPTGTVRSRIHTMRAAAAEMSTVKYTVSSAREKNRQSSTSPAYRTKHSAGSLLSSDRVRVVTTRYHSNLDLDIYYPPDSPNGRALPVVIFVMGWPDDLFVNKVGFKLKELSQYPFWASLIAASGIAAVLYETGQPEQDIHQLIRFLSRQGDSLGVDHRSIALWACSANVPTALHALVAVKQPYHKHLRCAAFYYPVVTFSPTAMHEVPTVLAARLPREVPVQLVRVGKERPEIRQSAMRMLDKMQKDRVPFECIRVPQSVHGFDIVQDDPATMAVISRTIAFLSQHLQRSYSGGLPPNNGAKGERRVTRHSPLIH